MNMITNTIANRHIYIDSPLNGPQPFYRKHVEDYLGSSFTEESYEMLLDEVIEDVERRIKAIFN